MIGVVADNHMGDGGLWGNATLDQPGRSRGLDHHVVAGAAGVLGPPHHQHAELGGHDVEPLGAVLPDQAQRTCAAGARLVLNIDDGLDPRQVLGQHAAVRPALGGWLDATLRMAGFLAGTLSGGLLLDLFKRQLQLVDGHGLGPGPKQ